MVSGLSREKGTRPVFLLVGGSFPLPGPGGLEIRTSQKQFVRLPEIKEVRALFSLLGCLNHTSGKGQHSQHWKLPITEITGNSPTLLAGMQTQQLFLEDSLFKREHVLIL